MLVRFAVLTKDKDYEVTGSYYLNDEEMLNNVMDQAVESTKTGHVQFYVLDTETMKVHRVNMEEE